MIFVTVGTHEQSFSRLIKRVDELKRDGVIEDEVVMQIGFTNYKPKYCKYYKLISYEEMWKYVKEARIVITHGGPASFVMPLQVGKIPIVVPRQEQYNEHINDHQVDFAKQIANRIGNIIPVFEIDDLEYRIVNYKKYIPKSKNGKNEYGNNDSFNSKFTKLIDKMFSKK